MRKRVACLSLIATVISHSHACAEALNEEVIRHRSLLMLGEVTHAASIAYGYTSHSSMGRTSTSQDLGESYGLSTQAALLDPNIFLLQLAAGVSYQQQLQKNNSKLLDYHYNIVGSAFQVSWHPVLVSSTRTTTQISNGYTPTYSLQRTSNRMSASLLHNMVPVRLFYTHATVATSGLAADTEGTSDTAGLSLQYNLGDRFNTDVSLSFDSSSSEGRESNSYSVFLLNKLALDKEKKYQLLTKATFADSVAADIPQRQASLSGALSGRLGKALTATLSDQFSYSSTLDFEGGEQEVKTNAISMGLSHKLYQSLTTAVTASLGKTSALGGEENSYNSNLTVAYVKVLPANSTLSVSANLGRTITRQDFEESELVARNEGHLVAAQGISFPLNLSGTIVRVDRVRSIDPVTSLETVYREEDGDYLLDRDTNRIRIPVGSAIAPGTTVEVTYAVALNRDLDFRSDIQTYLSILSLFGGRYTVTADYTVSNQEQISGEAERQALVDSTAMNIRGDAHYPNSSFGLEYGTVESTQEELWRTGVNWTYDTYLFSNDTMRISARDIFTSYGDSATSRGYQENLATLSVSYNRPVFSWLRLSLSSTLNDSRRRGASSNVVMFRTALDGNYNRMTVSLSGQSSYRLAEGNNTRDDAVNFKITRYF